MPFSHHSHSGQYVSHAEDTLDEIVDQAKRMNFRTYCLTEHCPRYSNDLLYPEESDLSLGDLSATFDRYMVHAKRIQKKVNSDDKSRLKILVGFESEGGIDDLHLQKYRQLRDEYDVQLIVGSVHYIDRVPIDFDREQWLEAKSHYNSFQDYFKAYFDCQYEVVEKLKPEVVSHFDLIRLFEDGDVDRCEITGKLLKDIDLKEDWPEVWLAIQRNIALINQQGGLIEFNSAAIRKGWDSPYPKRDITEYALSQSAKFCLSDDAHAISQVGLNYGKVLGYIQSLGEKIQNIYFWDLKDGKLFVNHETIAELSQDPFWKMNQIDD
ncbi:DEKNAAC102742 [Brettanomyces naardenensis]|uniref:Histidinol-phosphatase n=1 Tax=Brettanomyces naardenensis TaxID=13370 RepID=A0A448YKB1_BRENA|nr:DEKNAAC102742 [Brettanomyces naardenensis]